jgi:hypothetical protein
MYKSQVDLGGIAIVSPGQALKERYRLVATVYKDSEKYSVYSCYLLCRRAG